MSTRARNRIDLIGSASAVILSGMAFAFPFVFIAIGWIAAVD